MIIDPGELFTAAHKGIYEEKFRHAGIPMSALCFNNRFAWSLDKYYYFRLTDDQVCLYCDGEEGITSKHLVFPLGAPDSRMLKRIVDIYYPAFKAESLPLKMMYVPDDKLDMVTNLDGYDAEVVHKVDYDEYVYEAESLTVLKGKLLKSKKNQLNRFHRECSSCTYHKLTAADMDDCLKLTEEWCEAKGIDKFDVLNSDYIPIKIIFDNFDDLSIRGGVIRLFNKVIAFSIGSEPLADMAFIHFEKVDQTITGTNVAIVSEVVANEYPEVKFVNREEDMGIEGLRTAKQSYNPAYMMRKNDVLLRARGE